MFALVAYLPLETMGGSKLIEEQKKQPEHPFVAFLLSNLATVCTDR